jgi:hypothetical protein
LRPMKSLSSHARIFLVMLAAIFFFGCALVVGDKVVGFESGRFFYSDGVLKTEYKAPFDQTWAASEKAVSEIKATNVEKKKRIGFGTIDAVTGDEKIHIDLEYVAKDITAVGVRTGMAGNNLASKLIHEKISSNLLQH